MGNDSRPLLGILLLGLSMAWVTPAQVQIFTDSAAFQAATSSVPASIPNWTSLPVPSDAGSGCGEVIDLEAGATRIAVTAPAATSNFGLNRPICVCDLTCIANRPEYFMDSNPPSPVVAANGEDDYVFSFESPVTAVGVWLVTNDMAIESIALRDVNGSVIAVIDDASLETNPFSLEFVGLVSTTPIKTMEYDSTGGAVRDDGFFGLSVAPMPPQPETTINFDDLPAGFCLPIPQCAPDADTVLSSHLASLGVVFGLPGQSAGVAVIDGTQVQLGPSSFPNSIVGLDPVGNVPDRFVGSIFFGFFEPGSGAPAVTDSVSFALGDGGGDNDSFEIRAYGLDGQLLTSFVRPEDPSDVGRFPVDVSVNGIHRIEIERIPVGSGAQFGYSLDDLAFNALVGGTRSPDFHISALQPFQLVSSRDINGDSTSELVLGKPVGVVVELDVANFDLFVGPEVIVELTFGGSPSTLRVFKNSDFAPIDGIFRRTIVHFPDPEVVPPFPGAFELSARVDPLDEIIEFDEGNNFTSTTLSVKPTRDLHLAFVPVNGCEGSLESACGSLSRFNETVQNAVAFIQKVYPVRDGSLTTTITSPIIGRDDPNFGLGTDAVRVATWGILANRKVDKIIGVVPTNYFNAHFTLTPNTAGFAIWNSPSGLVIDAGDGALVAHELGHLFGIGCCSLASEEYDLEAGYRGDPAPGYDVRARERQLNKLCFMGAVGEDMAWVDEGHFHELFTILNQDPLDPESLLIGAVISSDGSVELEDWFVLAEGDLTPAPIETGYKVQLIDRAGNVLVDQDLPIWDVAPFDFVGVQPIDPVPLVAVVPFPPETWQLRILLGEDVLSTTNPSLKALRDLVRVLPDAAFVANPPIWRSLLHDRVNDLEQLVSGGTPEPQLQSLFDELRSTLSSALLVDYPRSDPIDFDRSEVLEVLDIVEVRVLTSARTPIVRCDVDANGSIDIVDIQSIVDARGTDVGPGDVRDADLDGRITVLDARQCTLSCTNPRCSASIP